MQYESEHVEYKSQMSDDIYKAVIAFANTGGGILYLGVDDQGNPDRQRRCGRKPIRA